MPFRSRRGFSLGRTSHAPGTRGDALSVLVDVAGKLAGVSSAVVQRSRAGVPQARPGQVRGPDPDDASFVEPATGSTVVERTGHGERASDCRTDARAAGAEAFRITLPVAEDLDGERIDLRVEASVEEIRLDGLVQALAGLVDLARANLLRDDSAPMAAARSEHRLQSIFEFVPVSIWIEDWRWIIEQIRLLKDSGVTDFGAYFTGHPQWVAQALASVRILDLNEISLRIFGAPDKAALKNSLQWVFATPDTLPGFIDELMALADGRPSFEGAMRLNTLDGRTIEAVVGLSFPEADDDTGVVLVSLMDTTALRQADRRLRDAQALSAVGERLARVGGWAADLGRNEIYWSPGVFDILEWKSGEAPSLSQALALYPPVHRERISTALQACAEHGTPFSLELEILTGGGRRIWTRAAGEAQRDADGEIQRVVGAFQDITEQTRLEREREQLSSRLGATLESMSDAYYLLDARWRFVYLNESAERLLRRNKNELIGREVWTEFPGTVDTVLHARYLEAASNHLPTHFEFWYAPLEQWFDVNAYPMADGLAVFFRAITERKRLDAQLRESEERFRLVSQATGDAVWDWDLRADTIWWNDGLRTIFGHELQANPEPATDWQKRIHPADLPRIAEGLRTAFDSTATAWEAEYRFAQGNGGWADVSDRGFLIRDESGRAVRMVGSVADVTERRALEQQLRQIQKLDAIGQLTGGVGHDFNNLLTVILGNAESLAEELSNDQRLRVLAEMTRTAAERGAELTTRLLAFARRQALDPQPTDVNRLLAGMDPLLRRTLGEHCEIEMIQAGGLWHALVDPPQLESAVLNLCLNARDAMPGGGRLTVETGNAWLDEAYATQHAEVTPGQYVLVAVSDTGSGMSADIVARAFDPFFTTKEVGKGSGLGLSMVYGFVKQSRGHVKIYSEPGQGTTVRIYLPRSGFGATDSPGMHRGSALDGGGGETILVVEDDPLVRAFATDQLKALGYLVLVAASGPEALEMVKSTAKIDLLFTDVVMPGGMSGRQLADAADALRPGIKVLFTSGYTENSIVHHGRLDPGVQLLNKPYRRQELAQKVRRALSRRDGDDKG